MSHRFFKPERGHLLLLIFCTLQKRVVVREGAVCVWSHCSCFQINRFMCGDPCGNHWDFSRVAKDEAVIGKSVILKNAKGILSFTICFPSCNVFPHP